MVKLVGVHWQTISHIENGRFLLSITHPAAEAKQRYTARANPPAKCHDHDTFHSFYYTTPAKNWGILSGRAVWLTVSDHCHVQADFLRNPKLISAALMEVL